MFRTIIVLLVGTSIANTLCGQNLLLNSSGTASVDHYSGEGRFTIPLYTVACDGMSVPIALNYRGASIKVNEQASPVGLGWTLTIGNVVSREVRGLPDEDPKGFLGGGNESKVKKMLHNQESSGYALDFDANSFAGKVADGTEDGEADIYHFSLPGYTGQFFFNKFDEVQFIPKQNIAFKADYDTKGVRSFKLITPDGVSYEFGGVDFIDEALVTSENVSRTYRMNWYLKSIFPPRASLDNTSYSAISFDYFSTQPLVCSTFTQRKLEYLVTHSRVCTFEGDPYLEERQDAPLKTHNLYHPEQETEILDRALKTNWTTITMINGIKKLTAISSNHEMVKFNWGTPRGDVINDFALDKIEVFNHEMELVQRYVLTYDYFLSYCPENVADCKRLKLLSLREQYPSETLAPYYFEYNYIENLPKRNSFEQDHWGYFNNNTAQTLIPAAIEPGNNFDRSGANRSPNENKMKANLLTKVVYPSTNSVEFNYEPNWHYDDDLEQAVMSGGVRVKEITYKTEGKAPVVEKYSYSLDPGYQFLEFKYEYKKKYAGYYNGLNETIKRCYHWLFDYYYYLVRSSEPINSSLFVNGRSLGYSTVKVSKANAGAITYTFSNLENILDRKILNGLLDYYREFQDHGIRSSADFYRGLLIGVEFTNSNGDLEKRIKHNYLYNFYSRLPSLRPIQSDDYECFVSPKGTHPYQEPGYDWTYQDHLYENSDKRILYESCSPQKPPIAPAIYFNFSEQIKLHSTITTTYLKATSGEMVASTSELYYVYNREGLIKQTHTTLGPSKTLLKRYTYPSDYTNETGFMTSLKDMNMSPVIEELSMIKYPDGNTVLKDGSLYVENRGGKYIVDGTIKTYKESNGMPDAEYKLQLGTPQRVEDMKFSEIADRSWVEPNPYAKGPFVPDNRYKRTIRYESYKNDNLLSQVRPENGMVVSYVYGYGANDLPVGVFYPSANGQNVRFSIAEVQNAEENEIAQTSFEGDLNSGGNWVFNIQGIKKEPIKAKTGTAYFAGTISKNDLPSCENGNHCRKYILSFWTYGIGDVLVNNTVVKSTNSIGWGYHEVQLTPTEAQHITLNTVVGNTTVYLDELRLYPEGARMKSFTYQPLVGKTSETDERNKTIYYEYDQRRRLSVVRDHNRNIIKKMVYHTKTN